MTIFLTAPVLMPTQCVRVVTSGGSRRRLLQICLQDCIIRVFDLDDPVPKARYQGHRELVTGIVKLESVGGYASCGWDKSLCLWQSHAVSEPLSNMHKRLLKVHDPFNDTSGIRHARGKRASRPSNVRHCSSITVSVSYSPSALKMCRNQQHLLRCWSAWILQHCTSKWYQR